MSVLLTLTIGADGDTTAIVTGVRWATQAGAELTLGVVADIGRWVYGNARPRFALYVPYYRTIAVGSRQDNSATGANRIRTGRYSRSNRCYDVNRVHVRRLAYAGIILTVYRVGIVTNRWRNKDTAGCGRCAVPDWRSYAVFNGQGYGFTRRNNRCAANDGRCRNIRCNINRFHCRCAQAAGNPALGRVSRFAVGVHHNGSTCLRLVRPFDGASGTTRCRQRYRRTRAHIVGAGRNGWHLWIEHRNDNGIRWPANALVSG